MNKVILIGGDLASGKSTYSQIIAKKFDIPVFNKDILKEILAEDIVTHNREENKKLSVASYKFFKYLVVEKISPMILESNFKTYEMEELSKLLEDNDYEVLSLRLIGDYEVLHQRFIERLKGNRNPVHRSQDLSKLEDYIAIIDDLRKTQYPGKVLTIDTTDFSYQTNEEYLKQIKEFLEK